MTQVFFIVNMHYSSLDNVRCTITSILKSALEKDKRSNNKSEHHYFVTASEVIDSMPKNSAHEQKNDLNVLAAPIVSHN